MLVSHSRLLCCCGTIALFPLGSPAMAQLGDTCGTAVTVSTGVRTFDLASQASEVTFQAFCVSPSPSFDQWAQYVPASDGPLSISIPNATGSVGISVYESCDAFPVACSVTGTCPGTV